MKGNIEEVVAAARTTSTWCWMWTWWSGFPHVTGSNLLM